MPTHEETARFWRDFDRLTPAQQARFKASVKEFVEDLRAGGNFRSGLRVKDIQKRPGWFEMIWAPDGRAIFQYGAPKFPGDVNIIWLRCGTHDVFEGL